MTAGRSQEFVRASLRRADKALSADTGFLGRMNHSKVIEAFDRILYAAKGSEVHCGIWVASVEECNHYIPKGFDS